MANKARGVFFLVLFVILMGFLVYQVNSYIEQMKIADEQVATAKENLRQAQIEENRATQAFNSLK